VLEEQFPELAVKAKKYLGYELYYDISVMPDDQPIKSYERTYQKMMRMANELNDNV
jgi:hypothetical protein